MRYYTRLKEDAGDDDIGLLLVADAEIFRLDAVVRWLDAADARIKRLPADRSRHRQLARLAASRAAGWGHGDDRAPSSCGRCRKSYGEGATLVEALQRRST